MPVTLFLSLAFYAYLRYRREGRWWWTALGGFWVALATLTKGILWPPANWVRGQVEPVDESTFAAAWRQQRVFALLAPDMAPRLHPKPDPIVLLQTPLGWRLVTNR